jgi:hypothetical protein
VIICVRAGSNKDLRTCTCPSLALESLRAKAKVTLKILRPSNKQLRLLSIIYHTKGAMPGSGLLYRLDLLK